MTMLSGFDDDIARDCPPGAGFTDPPQGADRTEKSGASKGAQLTVETHPPQPRNAGRRHLFSARCANRYWSRHRAPQGLSPPRLAANTNAPKAQHNHTASRVEGILEDLLPPKSLIEHAEERFQDHSRRPLFSTGSGSGFCSSAHLDLYAGIAAMTRGLESSISGAGPIRAKKQTTGNCNALLKLCRHAESRKTRTDYERKQTESKHHDAPHS